MSEDNVADGHDLAMHLRTAYLALHRRTGTVVAPFGLTADQFVVLTVLSDGDALTQKELVKRTGSDPNTMSEMLARLEQRGLILRERHATDGRARSVSLTREGKRVQRQSWNASEPLRVELRKLFRDEMLDAFVEDLKGIGNVMDAKGGQETRAASGDRAPRRRTRAATELKRS